MISSHLCNNFKRVLDKRKLTYICPDQNTPSHHAPSQSMHALSMYDLPWIQHVFPFPFDSPNTFCLAINTTPLSLSFFHAPTFHCLLFLFKLTFKSAKHQCSLLAAYCEFIHLPTDKYSSSLIRQSFLGHFHPTKFLWRHAHNERESRVLLSINLLYSLFTFEFHFKVIQYLYFPFLIWYFCWRKIEIFTSPSRKMCGDES